MYKFISIFIVLISLIYLYFVPEDKLPLNYELAVPPTLNPPIEINKKLLKADKLFNNIIKAPETTVYFNGFYYTGTLDGRIMKFTNELDLQTFILLGGPKCENYIDAPTCGRPLGLKIHSDGYLIVADAYLGIITVDLKTTVKQVLVPPGLKVDGQEIMFFNSIAVSDSNGNIYFTDSTTYPLHMLMDEIMDSKPLGRLLMYHVDTLTTSVLLKNLYFPNGIAFSYYEDFLIIAETTRARVLKYNLKGLNSGKLEIFADNLPGLPDNIHVSPSGGFWIALPLIRHSENKINLMDILAPYPWIRNFLKLLPLESILNFFPLGTMVIKLNETGHLVEALMDPTGSHVSYITDAFEHEGYLYLGSYKQHYLARVPYP